MKIIAQIVLFVFILFLVTPTIVSIIEKDADTSVFYSLSEEEKENKEIKAVFNFELNFAIPSFPKIQSGLILSENLSKHDKISSPVLIPPPDFV